MTATKGNNLEPLITFEFLISFATMCARAIMGDYLNENWTWKWNPALFQSIGCCVVTGLCYFWTGYENRHELTQFVFSACLIMIDILAV